jgi:hypothetical protein
VLKGVGLSEGGKRHVMSTSAINGVCAFAFLNFLLTPAAWEAWGEDESCGLGIAENT